MVPRGFLNSPRHTYSCYYRAAALGCADQVRLVNVLGRLGLEDIQIAREAGEEVAQRRIADRAIHGCSRGGRAK